MSNPRPRKPSGGFTNACPSSSTKTLINPVVQTTAEPNGQNHSFTQTAIDANCFEQGSSSDFTDNRSISRKKLNLDGLRRQKLFSHRFISPRMRTFLLLMSATILTHRETLVSSALVGIRWASSSIKQTEFSRISSHFPLS
jgi:hypothetical protein